MSEQNAVVAVYGTHIEAEEAVKELQRAGTDMRTLSIVACSAIIASTEVSNRVFDVLILLTIRSSGIFACTSLIMSWFVRAAGTAAFGAAFFGAAGCAGVDGAAEDWDGADWGRLIPANTSKTTVKRAASRNAYIV